MTLLNRSQSAVTRLVDSLPQRYYRCDEVAQAFGVTKSAVAKAVTVHENLRPGHVTYIGKLEVFLFDEDDVERLRVHFEGGKMGRPRIWTTEESSDRDQRRRTRAYHQRRAAAFDAQGKPEDAARSRAFAARMTSTLDAQLDRRLAGEA